MTTTREKNIESTEDVQYTILSDIKEPGIRNIFGIVKYASEIRVSIKAEYFLNLSLVDDSMPLNEIEVNKIKCLIFSKSRESLKAITQGCLMRFHRMKFKIYKNELRGENSPAGFAWTVFKSEPNSGYEPIEKSSKTFTHISVQSMEQIEKLRSWFVANREKILDETNVYKEPNRNLNPINKSNFSIQENNSHLNQWQNVKNNIPSNIDSSNIVEIRKFNEISVSSHLLANSIMNIADDKSNEHHKDTIYPVLDRVQTLYTDKGINMMQFVSDKNEFTRIKNDEELIKLKKRNCSLMSLGDCEYINCKKLRDDLPGQSSVESRTNPNIHEVEFSKDRAEMQDVANDEGQVVKRTCCDQNEGDISQIQSDDSYLNQFTIIDSSLDPSCLCLKCLLDVKPPFIGCTEGYLVDIVPSLMFPKQLIKLKCLECGEAYLLPSNFNDKSFQLTDNMDYVFPAFIDNNYYCPRCSTNQKLVQLVYSFMFRLIFQDGDQLLSCNMWEINDSYFLDLSSKDILENTDKSLRCLKQLKDIQKKHILKIGIKAFYSLSDKDSVSFKLHMTKLIY